MEKASKLSDRVIIAIQKDISQGKYKPGQKIPAEPELMVQYAVGRSTIREAIKTLAISGVLRVQQGAGTFVNEAITAESLDQRLRRADFEEINQVRRMLDFEIVKLAAANRTEEDMQQMEKQLNLRKKAILDQAYQPCVEADIAFHMAIARACGNQVMADLYQSFTLVIRNFFAKRDTQSISHFAISHHLHEQLFKAIKNGNQRLSRQVMEDILDNNY
ncbi:FadR family transcriptional regulator [Chitinophaga silvatica]|uniref:FadR family transcriptional regulator n=1 Tax=Chitinophaga silvatica TaxID=2282649 RepID=A0A3E1YF24_9BACT|nr:FadR/GntR family transcriptional regulator [Chitinophaga silvatica]RFS25111.1 FadR family transcriptional regulator [Chitinophaga silvatica]